MKLSSSQKTRLDRFLANRPMIMKLFSASDADEMFRLAGTKDGRHKLFWVLLEKELIPAVSADERDHLSARQRADRFLLSEAPAPVSDPSPVKRELYSFYIDPADLQKLKDYSKKDDRPVARLVRDAIKGYLRFLDNNGQA